MCACTVCLCTRHTTPDAPTCTLPTPAALQVASRLWVLWGVIVPVQGPTTSGAIVLGHVGGVTLQLNLASLLVAWCLSEVVRYSFFALKVQERRGGEGGGEGEVRGGGAWSIFRLW